MIPATINVRAIATLIGAPPTGLLTLKNVLLKQNIREAHAIRRMIEAKILAA
jgi:hypothetical protein